MLGSRSAETCRQRESHTPCPEGYLQWHDWAKTMGKTHHQVKCPGCDLYAIWLARTPRPAASKSFVRGDER